MTFRTMLPYKREGSAAPAGPVALSCPDGGPPCHREFPKTTTLLLTMRRDYTVPAYRPRPQLRALCHRRLPPPPTLKRHLPPVGHLEQVPARPPPLGSLPPDAAAGAGERRVAAGDAHGGGGQRGAAVGRDLVLPRAGLYATQGSNALSHT